MATEKSGKRYYWLKLQDDFFKSKRIKKLRKIAGGDTYTIIYLKMQLLAMKNNGVLEFTGLENTFAEELALDLDEEPENVAVTVNYLLSCGLLETDNETQYFVPYAVENTGCEGAAAKRMREMRARKASQCYADVTPVLQERYGEKEKELEIEIDKEIYRSTTGVNPGEKSPEKPKKGDGNPAYKEIIDYLNTVCGTSYRATSKATQRLISARLHEGFTVEDFKAVIRTKHAEWANDAKMSKFLRPETLFGTKFESYLNQCTESHETSILDDVF